MLMKSVIALACLLLTAAQAFAQTSPCKFLCEPTFLVEPTITFEKDATVFALDMSTPMPRVGVTLEAVTKLFRDENDVEIESELNLNWLESSQTGAWLSSHFDIIDKFSGAERDRHACIAGPFPSCSSFRSSKAGRGAL